MRSTTALVGAAALILGGCTVTTTTSSGTTTRTYNPFASSESAPDAGAPEGAKAARGDPASQVQGYCDMHEAYTSWVRTSFANVDTVRVDDAAGVDALCKASQEVHGQYEKQSMERSRVDSVLSTTQMPQEQFQALWKRTDECAGKDSQEINRLTQKGYDRCKALKTEQAKLTKSRGELEALNQALATPPANPRSLADHALPFGDHGNDEGLIQKAFMEAVPSRFVFALVPLEGNRVGNNYGDYRPVPRGEALLLAEVSGERASVYTVEGQHLWGVDAQALSVGPIAGADPMPLKPDWIEVYGEDWRTHSGWYAIHEQDSFPLEDNAPFMKFADTSDPVVQKYITELDAIRSCYNRQMDKLDPDGKRNHYDIETFDRNGNTKKIESMTSVLDRKVCATCRCSAFVAKQRGVAAHILKPKQEEVFAKAKPAIARVKGLFRR